jgi:hypothetical protein
MHNSRDQPLTGVCHGAPVLSVLEPWIKYGPIGEASDQDSPREVVRDSILKKGRTVLEAGTSSFDAESKSSGLLSVLPYINAKIAV